MKSLLSCLAATAVLSGVAPGALAQSNNTVGFVQGPAIVLSAQIVEEVTEDTAHATLLIERESRDPAEAQRQANVVLQESLRLVKQVSALEVSTGHFHTIAIRDSEARIAHYRSQAELRIQSQDLAAVARTAAQLAANAHITSTAFSLSRQKREDVERGLIESLVREFNAKAGAMAAALGYARFEINQATVNSSSHSPSVDHLRPLSAMPQGAPAAAMAPVVMQPSRARVNISMSGTVLLRK